MAQITLSEVTDVKVQGRGYSPRAGWLDRGEVGPYGSLIYGLDGDHLPTVAGGSEFLFLALHTKL